MLAFGDLTWVPFTYSLQSRFLVHHDPKLPHSILLIIVIMKVCGYMAFRGSNGEKDRFRTNPNDPSVSYLQTIQTKTGRRLLISGWWGMARKINYSADWLMGLAWCSVCGK
jgi:delta14-sterol reductase